MTDTMPSSSEARRLVPARIIVAMGVSSSGKTSTGKALARRLHAPFLDGDDFHSPDNKKKMGAGTPLSDDDRWPWLGDLARSLHEAAERKGVAIGACSALKRAYRDIVVGDRPDVGLVHLRGSRELIGRRMAARKGHFMPTALLDNQFATLQEPAPEERAIAVDIGGTPAEIVEEILRLLGPELKRQPA